MLDGSNISHAPALDSDESVERKYLFLYPDIATPAIKEIESGTFPKERLTGYFQLKQMGLKVAISDSQWRGPTAKLRRKLLRYGQLPSFHMLKDWTKNEVIVVKDRFSLVYSLLAKLLGKKIVYLDTMFQLPTNKLKRLLLKHAIRHSDLVISLSKTQGDHWAQELQPPSDKLESLYYSMDCSFYPLVEPKAEEKSPLIVSIGRDRGRDFETLTKATTNLGINLELITLPYLLPPSARTSPHIVIKARLPYDELFATYARASIAIIPLKSGIHYPSGIRAVMEAMLVGVPVIASYTPVLAEYFTDGVDLIMVEPENARALEDAINRLLSDPELRLRLRENGRKTVCTKYKVESYGEDLARLLSKV